MKMKMCNLILRIVNSARKVSTSKLKPYLKKYHCFNHPSQKLIEIHVILINFYKIISDISRNLPTSSLQSHYFVTSKSVWRQQRIICVILLCKMLSNNIWIPDNGVVGKFATLYNYNNHFKGSLILNALTCHDWMVGFYLCIHTSRQDWWDLIILGVGKYFKTKKVR